MTKPEREPLYRPVKSQRAFEEISAQIRELRASGAVKPGDRLPAERDLAIQFGVSRNTLREAIRLLEFSGLVKLRKGMNGGAFVREHNGDNVVAGLRDLYTMGAIQPSHLTEVRIGFETLVIESAIKRATRADIELLEANFAIATRAEQVGDIALRASASLEFHRLLGRFTRNPILEIVMDSLMEIMSLFIRDIGPYHAKHVLQSRSRFLQYFAAGDCEAAVKEMESHLKRLQRYYLARHRKLSGRSAE